MRILHSKKLIFISKPRCGSTSVRRFLDSKMEPGDESSDYGNDSNELHPHMSAPAVHEYLKNKGVDISAYRTFTITRKPLTMLWSYFNYFKPDINSYYNYSPNYEPSKLASFAEWLENGKVGIGLWRKYCPSYITDSDFSPLSLEAHSNNITNEPCIDKVFRLENLVECKDWLQNYFDNSIDISEINSSNASSVPVISEALQEKIYQQFPLESNMYKLPSENFVTE